MTVPDFIRPMEARLSSRLPDGEGWQFEPKWDGFRCIAVKNGNAIELWGKSGKPLGRYFPEVMDMIRAVPQDKFVLDGELIVPIAGVGSFEALQQRLHPAESRIRKLSVQTPALLVVFDMLQVGNARWLEHPLVERRIALEAFVKAVPLGTGLRLSPATVSWAAANKWFTQLSQELDGVIAKRLDEPYASGERAMLKIKRIRTADCVVGGFRYGTGSKLVGSLLLGLYNEAGRLDHVGFTSAFSKEEKPALTTKLEKLRGGPGFTGNAPGGPSRWSTERSSQWEPLEPELVAEVRYDQITGKRFRHGTGFVRWRPDKAPQTCTFEQLAVAVDPDTITEAILATH